MVTKKSTVKRVRKTIKVTKPIRTTLKSRTVKTTRKPEKKYKHPRNMALVETLDAVENKLANRKTEHACYVEKDTGKCLFCTTNGRKNSVTPTDKEVKLIKEKGKKLIVTHSHPKPYNSSLTSADIECAINNDSAGIRAVTKKWTYVAMPKDRKNWKVNWMDVDRVYNEISDKIEKKWNNDYYAGKISKGYYEDNMTHVIMEKVAKKLGFTYFRFKN